MEVWDSIIRFFGVIAWPVVVIVFMVLFRRYINQLLRRLSRVRYGDMEVNFDEQLEKAEDRATQLKLTETESIRVMERMTQSDETKTIERLELLADVSPRAAVQKAWSTLYQELKKVEQLLGLEHTPNKVGRIVLARLVREGKLEKEAIDLYLDLRKIRNEAVRETEFEITRDTVDRYFNLILPLTSRIRGIMAEIESQKRPT